jgi:hypothetical protein
MSDPLTTEASNGIGVDFAKLQQELFEQVSRPFFSLSCHKEILE